MNKPLSIPTGLILGGYLFLVGQPAQGLVPRPTVEPRTSSPGTGTVIAKKAKGQAAKKGGKASSGEDSADNSKKKAPTKAEALKDIDDISKK